MSVCMSTESNAFVMSRDVMIVRLGGFCWLKPVEMVLFIWCSAVVVECCFLKPCCAVTFGMFSVMYGRMIFSNVLAIGERSEMGL